jgi:hypothetical protein
MNCLLDDEGVPQFGLPNCGHVASHHEDCACGSGVSGVILRRSHLNSAQDEAKAETSRTLIFVGDQARVRSSKLSPDLYDGITESGLPARSSRFSPRSAPGIGLGASLVHFEAAAA